MAVDWPALWQYCAQLYQRNLTRSHEILNYSARYHEATNYTARMLQALTRFHGTCTITTYENQ